MLRMLTSVNVGEIPVCCQTYFAGDASSGLATLHECQVTDYRRSFSLVGCNMQDQRMGLASGGKTESTTIFDCWGSRSGMIRHKIGKLGVQGFARCRNGFKSFLLLSVMSASDLLRASLAVIDTSALTSVAYLSRTNLGPNNAMNVTGGSGVRVDLLSTSASLLLCLAEDHRPCK